MSSTPPLEGQLIPLKTVQELQISSATDEACVVEIPIRLASQINNIFKGSHSLKYQCSHLRRFVKHEHLPRHLRETPPTTHITNPDGSETEIQTIFLLFPAFTPPPLVIKCYLQPHVPFPVGARMIQIPVYPPPTQELADEWSQEYWPVTYNPSSQPLQHSPPPHLLRTVRASIEKDVGRYMALARQVGEEARKGGAGRGVGAVIVDPTKGTVVAVAGDARWWTPSHTILKILRGSPENPAQDESIQRARAAGNGRPELHALMRAISLVSRKRLQQPSLPSTPQLELSNLSLDDAQPAENPSVPRAQEVTSSASVLSELPLPTHPHLPPPDRTDLAAIGLNCAMPSVPTPPLPAAAVPTLANNFKRSPIVQNPASQPPLSALEAEYFDSLNSPIQSRAEGGYLCTNLDLYITNEPCVSCGMGMLHSRFRCVVFGKRMHGTGSLCAENGHPFVRMAENGYLNGNKVLPSLGYGLFWRRELNWRTVAFEFADKEDVLDSEDGELFHV